MMSADHEAARWKHDGVRVGPGDRLDPDAAQTPEGVAGIDATHPAPPTA
jgi:hypothetical protein